MNKDVQSMDYNTEREPMRIAEYGRTIQKLVAQAKAIADREERNKAARAIIKVMTQLNPNLRQTEDLNQKLWDHMFMIADFDFDVDSPYPVPNPEQFKEKPEPIAYPDTEVGERHYGRIIIKMVQQLAAEEDVEKRQKSAIAAANAMKSAYLKWNRDTVDDYTIIADLRKLSKGVVALPADTVLGKAQDLVDHSQQNSGMKSGRSNKRNKRNKKRRNPRV
ncbi:MAG: DUF4290 domain-containing protein [Flavobacteriales bacterium]|nr:DUF4290 domain-containing protein [Flavobacteriales bacterium]